VVRIRLNTFSGTCPEGNLRAMLRPARTLIAAALATLVFEGQARAQDAACKDPFERAQELRQEGKLTASRAELDRCVAACPAELGEQCRIWIGEIEPQIGRIVVIVVDQEGKPHETAALVLDGRDVPRGDWAGALRVDPGPHDVAVSAPGAVADRRALTVTPGATERITLTLRGVVTPIAPTTPGEGGGAGRGGWIALGGVGLAALLAGSAAAIGGHVLAADYGARCRGRDLSCTDATAAAWRSEVEGTWIAGGVLAGLGGIAGAAAILGVTLGGSSPSRAAAPLRAQLVAGPAGLGLGVRF
jgi:hypothetical protein